MNFLRTVEERVLGEATRASSKNEKARVAPGPSTRSRKEVHAMYLIAMMVLIVLGLTRTFTVKLTFRKKR